MSDSDETILPAAPATAGPLDGVTRQVGGAVTRAAGLAGWLDRTGWNIARRLPGGATAERAVRPVEQALAGELRRRLHALGLLDREPQRPPADVPPMRPEPEPLRAAMAELLGRSDGLSAEQSEHQLFALVLRQLVPDEARMLAALADGSVYPLVHVAARGPLGGIKRLVLENVTTLGAAAGIRLPANTAAFVGHLLQLGLVDVDPEDRVLADQYDVLEKDELVAAAEREARIDGRGGARTIRQTIRLSAFGRRFWAACRPAIPARPATPSGASPIVPA